MMRWSNPAEGHQGDSTPTLFDLDTVAPTSVDPVAEFRRVEREYHRLQAEADADSALIDAIEDDTGVFASHPSQGEEWHPSDPALCPWCRQEARVSTLREMEAELVKLQGDALEAVRRAKG